MNNMTDIKGNLTTIIKFTVMTIAPYIGMSETVSNQWIAILTAIIGLILAYFDAKYPNTIINNNTDTLETQPLSDTGDDNGA